MEETCEKNRKMSSVVTGFTGSVTREDKKEEEETKHTKIEINRPGWT
jgi:hypothetical protein